jgi:RNA polymerase sigma factor (sigma-70 family)
MEPSDESLVLACRNGDAAAWETLVERYQRLIFALARHAGLNEEQAADVFQRVFTLLFEALNKIEQPALIGAWLTTTTRHEAWRFSRRERAATRIYGTRLDQANTLTDDELLPEAMVLRLEEQHKVRLAVASLDTRCRRLLELLFYRPDTPAYAEIAAALGMSEGGIGPTRARCLEKLRRRLEVQGF